METSATIETFVTQVVGAAALGLATWLGFSLLLWSVVLPRPDHLLVRLTTLTMPGTRRVAQLLLAAGIAACSPPTDADTPTLVWVGDAESSTLTSTSLGSTTELSTTQPTTTQPTTTQPTTTQAPTSPSTSTILPQTSAPPAEPPLDVGPLVDDEVPAAEFHVVTRGENLWSIAADTVGTRLGRSASSTEIANYWRELIELNRAALSSGNPDLIYPGETLRLTVQ